MVQIQHRFSKNDEYYTSSYVVYLIMKYLKAEATMVSFR